MAKKCVYCGKEISNDSAIDVCERCGLKVWGDKMFSTIKQNMQDAQDKGDLCNQNLPVMEFSSKKDKTYFS